MNAEERYKIDNIGSKKWFHVDSSTLESDIDYIVQNKISNVLIAPWGELYKRKDIDWVTRISDYLTSLKLATAKGNFSYSGIGQCKNLKYLELNNQAKEVIDLSKNTNLEELNISLYGCDLNGLNKLKRLRRIRLSKAKNSLYKFSNFSDLKMLNEIDISYSDLSDGLSFLIETPIQGLKFYSCRNLDFLDMSKLKLKSLWIEKCKKVLNFDEIYCQCDLRKLVLVDSNNIRFGEDILRFKKLKRFTIYGSSQIEDGKVSMLKERIQLFSFSNKKHYDLKITNGLFFYKGEEVRELKEGARKGSKKAPG